MLILAIIVIAVFAGWLANLLLGGGTRPQDWGEIALAGLIGSFVGGMLGNLLTEGELLTIRLSGIIGSTVGAVIVLLIWRGVRGSKVGKKA
jgi:uncharacterized membrane protein YeaQ/YmgE (transglycosylase-associated protein family)